MSALHIPLPPYAVNMGIELDHLEGHIPILGCDFSTRVLGRPGHFHGEALGGLLEMAALAAAREELALRGAVPRLKPVNISVQYMRGAVEARCFARGHVERAGRRLLNVSAVAWQDSPERPVATAWLNVMVSPT